MSGRASKPQHTHFSLQGYSKEGTAGWRAAVHHAVVTQPKRATASEIMLRDAWVALPPALWSLHTRLDGPPTAALPPTRRVSQSAGGAPRSLPVPPVDARWPVVNTPRMEGEPSWRSFALAQIERIDPPAPDDPTAQPVYVLKVDPKTVPRGQPHVEEVRLTRDELLPANGPWHVHGPWATLPATVRANRVPPLCPAVLVKG